MLKEEEKVSTLLSLVKNINRFKSGSKLNKPETETQMKAFVQMKMNSNESFPGVLPYKVVLTFSSVYEILKYYHSNESY